jgi:hypothetical protein
VFALLLSLALVGDVYTVDDNGPADFTDIQSAIDAVPAGSTLLVEVGADAGFALDKRLTILGHAGPFEPFVGTEPWVGSASVVDGASTFVLAGFRMQKLDVRNVPGRGIVDDCTVLHSVSIDHCAQIELGRLVVSPAESQYPALAVHDSGVMLVDAGLVGGMGFSPLFGSGGKGEPALRATGGSLVVVAGSTLVGGAAGQSSASDGPAGDGVLCIDSLVIVRGSGGDLIDDGSYEPRYGGTQGSSVRCIGGLVQHSGVPLPAGALAQSGGQVVQVTPAEPYLEITGDDDPGAARSLDVYGPRGTALLLLVATGPGPFGLAKLELPLWLDPSTLPLLLPLTTLGQDMPLSLTATLPASLVGLEGFTLHVQGVAPGVPSAFDPGTHLVTNAAPLVLRF